MIGYYANEHFQERKNNKYGFSYMIQEQLLALFQGTFSSQIFVFVQIQLFDILAFYCHILSIVKINLAYGKL